MRALRRKEKAIEAQDEMTAILEDAKYVTVAMCMRNEPYLVTLSHGYDRERNCLYFLCARDGKKIDILKENSVIWGQALLDKGYGQGACNHLYATTQFRGTASLIEDIEEKRHALEVMIEGLEDEPGSVKAKQITEESVKGVGIGRIDINSMSGKKSEGVIISPWWYSVSFGACGPDVLADQHGDDDCHVDLPGHTHQDGQGFREGDKRSYIPVSQSRVVHEAVIQVVSEA